MRVRRFVLGFAAGGWWLQDTRPRSLLALPACERCLHPNEVAGLLTAGLIHSHPAFVPSVVAETDRVIAIKHPFPKDKFHFVIFPKRDVRNLGDVDPGEREDLVEVMAVGATLIRDHHLQRYRFWTNGPEGQATAYLHFHLSGSDEP